MEKESGRTEVAHLWSLIEEFDSAMLVTVAGSGALRSRPMAIAGCEGGIIYFATGIDSPKVAELEAHHDVNVAIQGKTKYVSLSGHAHVVEDRQLVERLWKEQWKVWFPNGKEDPNLCLVAVDPIEAEYWDNGGGKGVRFLFDAVRAYVTRKPPHDANRDQHAKVRL